jgi:hypothetical protein
MKGFQEGQRPRHLMTLLVARALLTVTWLVADVACHSFCSALVLQRGRYLILRHDFCSIGTEWIDEDHQFFFASSLR